MPTTINASNTTGGAVVTGDGSGILELQSGGVTGITVNGPNVTVAGTITSTGGLSSPVTVTGNSTAGAEIRLPEDTDNGSNYVAIKAPNALAANVTFTLPTADGTNGQYLQTNGAGQLAFASVSPGGTTGQVQYNNSGAFGGLPSGNAGQVLTSAGSGAAPTWGNVSSVGDVIYSTQAPSASWLPCSGGVYSKASYPTLATLLGSLSNPMNATWTSANRSNQLLQSIIFSGGTYYASTLNFGSSNGGLYSSTDLTNWTTLLSATSQNHFQDMHYISGSNRIIGYNGGNKEVAYMNSPFTTRTAVSNTNFFGFSGTYGGLTYDGANTLVLCGSNREFQASDFANLRVSTNGGTSFSTVSAPVSGFGDSGTYASGSAYGAGRFVVCGNLTNTNSVEIMHSTNGSSWTRVLVSATNEIAQDVAFVNGFFYLVTSTQLFRSADGVSWTSYSPANRYIGSTINMAQTSAGTLLWANPANNTSSYLTSTDNGTTWSTNTMVYGTNPIFYLMKRGRSFANNFVWPTGTLNSGGAVIYGAGFDYDPSTQFKMPTFSSLSTLSGTYTAPVTAFMRAI